MDKYNCFKCDGKNIPCGSYMEYRRTEICMYKRIANKDLENQKKGIKNIVLEDMLKRYLRRVWDET